MHSSTLLLDPLCCCCCISWNVFSLLRCHYAMVFNDFKNMISILVCCCYMKNNLFCCVCELVQLTCIGSVIHVSIQPTDIALKHGLHFSMFVVGHSCHCCVYVPHHHIHHCCDGALAAFQDCLLCCPQVSEGIS